MVIIYLIFIGYRTSEIVEAEKLMSEKELNKHRYELNKIIAKDVMNFNIVE